MVELGPLLDRCTITVPTATVKAIGEKVLEIFEDVPPVPGTLYDHVRWQRWNANRLGKGGRVLKSARNVLFLYSNADPENPEDPDQEQIGPAWLTTIDMSDTRQTLKPTKMYVFSPDEFRNAAGRRTEAGLIVARGLQIDATSEPPMDNDTLRGIVVAQAVSGEAMPRPRDFNDLLETLETVRPVR